MPFGGPPGPGAPGNLTEGAGTEADDPAGEQRLEGDEDLGVEARAERLYQHGERGDKLIHRANLRAVRDPGGVVHPQDSNPVRDGPFLLRHQRLL
jgi:hypothetical protein